MARGRIYRFRVARDRAVAPAVVRRAQERTAFDDLATGLFAYISRIPRHFKAHQIGVARQWTHLFLFDTFALSAGANVDHSSIKPFPRSLFAFDTVGES